MQDPFFAVKEEVEHSVTVVNQLHSKWIELRSFSAKSDEFEWTSSELLSGLRSIDWDLQDLEDTVSIVESSRQKFQLDDAEVQARKAFIESTRNRISAMRDEVQGVSANEPGGFSTKTASQNNISSIGSVQKGYGRVGSEEEAMEKGLQPVASADGDEILGGEALSPAKPPEGRHRRKKIFIAVMLLLLIGSLLAAMASQSSKPVAAALDAVAASPPASPAAESARRVSVLQVQSTSRQRRTQHSGDEETESW
mmetsp:Transcript_73734/g.123144  ORF Transcript_73734/g.123144 Transcript_73734/m.123144 type:complete len:253 (+) Transcript_73734:110-868(+)